MKEKYQKFEINMERQSESFRLWKNGVDEVVCILETYKEKRSIYFSVKNFLPSSYLYREQPGTYHIVLLGMEDGQLCHRDFGTFHVDQNGEGSFFQKFTGPALSCYTHCLLVADWGETTEAEVICRGQTPFFVKAEVKNVWQERRQWCTSQTPTKVFSTEVDETGAQWYRVPVEEELPEALEETKSFILKYNHYLFGFDEDACFVGIPGRFLQKEQPCREKGQFLLWQPLRGGEKFFDHVSTMTAQQQEEIFGYWIAAVDMEDGILKPL